MSGARAICRLLRRYLPFWCTGSSGAVSWLDEGDADGHQLQIEWLGFMVSFDIARRNDRAIAHSDAIFAPIIPAKLNHITGLWECTI